MDMTPGTYLRKRRKAAGMSIEAVASIITTDPHVDEFGRAAWLRAIEGGTAPIGAAEIHALRAAFAFNPVVLRELAAHQEDPSRPAPRLCRVCACSDYDACVDAHRRACSWVGPDLCSTHHPHDAGAAETTPVDDEDETAAPSPDADQQPQIEQRSNAYYFGDAGNDGNGAERAA